MEPIEALLAAIAALNGIKKLLSESDSEIERRQLKEKQRELELEINRLRRKIAKLEKKKGGREVLLRLLYCQHCGNLRNIESAVNPSFHMLPCQKCKSWGGEGKVKTIRMWFKYSHQTSVWLTQCPRCGSINETSLRLFSCKCLKCGYKFNSSNKWQVLLS